MAGRQERKGTQVHKKGPEGIWNNLVGQRAGEMEWGQIVLGLVGKLNFSLWFE